MLRLFYIAEEDGGELFISEHAERINVHLQSEQFTLKKFCIYQTFKTTWKIGIGISREVEYSLFDFPYHIHRVTLIPLYIRNFQKCHHDYPGGEDHSHSLISMTKL